jgi:hypothetical protein
MSELDKLKRLLARCKAGVTLEVNDHRSVYESAEETLDTFADLGFKVDEGIRRKIIETDTLIDLHFYPDTPVGFHKIIHYDLDAALDMALACVAPPASPNHEGAP